MTRSYVLLLSLLALIWGGSYALIRVGVRGFEPTTLMLIRVAVAGVVLTGLLAVRGELAALRRAPRGAYLLGILVAVIPFTLIAWGEQHVDSGTAAVANAGIPLFVALLAPFVASGERVTGSRLLGLLLGLGGVAWLVGLHPSGGWRFIAGAIAIVVAAFSFALGTIYSQRLVSGTSALVLATSAFLGATLVALPFGVAQAPHAWPGWKPLAAILTLAVLASVVAQLLWLHLLERYGSSRVSLVSYLMPAVALAYGSLFLGESLDLAKVGGLALVLLGVVLAARRQRVSPATAPVAGA